MLIRVDREQRLSLTEQIAAEIRRLIDSAALSKGERLPPARQLAAAVDVNMHTVLRAYAVLQDEGLIDMRRGRGAIVIAVAPDPAEQLNLHIHDLLLEAANAGVTRAELVTMIRGMK